MKTIMHLYRDKVTITEREELMPLMKSNRIHVAASTATGIIYSNLSKEVLDDFISRNVEAQPNLFLLKLALELAPEVKTVSDLKIGEDDTVSIEETVEANVLMINKGRMVIIAGLNGKLYTNNALAAKQCIHEDVLNGELNACLLERAITVKGMVECKLEIE